LVATLITAALGFTDTALSLAIMWTISAAVIALVVVVFQTLGATILPDNRGGALSFLLAFRFLGHAVGPIVFIPMIDRTARGALVGSAALGLITLAILAILASRFVQTAQG